MSMQKNKGSAFENEMAKWFNAQYDTNEFARVPMSGAFMGKSNAQRRSGIAEAARDTLRGDLITPPDFPYVVECKSYKDQPLFHKLLAGSDAKVNSWLSEVEFDALQANKQPMLIFKSTRKGTFVCIPFSNYTFPMPKSMMIYKRYIIMSLEKFESIAGNLYK